MINYISLSLSLPIPGNVSPKLQKANVPLIGRSRCSSPTIYGSLITPRMICAGYLDGKVDACQVRLAHHTILSGIKY